MFYLDLIDAKTASTIKMIRIIIIIENVFLISFAVRVKIALNILSW